MPPLAGGATPSSRLTPFYFYFDAKVKELKAEGRTRVTANEAVELYKALSDAERQPWEDKAAAACEAYLKERTAAAVERRAALEAGGEADEGDGEEEDEEGADDGEGNGGEGEGGEADEEGDGKVRSLPYSKIRKLIGLNAEVPKVQREAVSCILTATETFLERCVWDASRVTNREGRKTIAFKDFVASMREHRLPESMQFFVEELGPKPEPAPQPTKAGAKRKASGASSSRAGESSKAKGGAAAKGGGGGSSSARGGKAKVTADADGPAAKKPKDGGDAPAPADDAPADDGRRAGTRASPRAKA